MGSEKGHDRLNEFGKTSWSQPEDKGEAGELPHTGLQDKLEVMPAGVLLVPAGKPIPVMEEVLEEMDAFHLEIPVHDE